MKVCKYACILCTVCMYVRTDHVCYKRMYVCLFKSSDAAFSARAVAAADSSVAFITINGRSASVGWPLFCIHTYIHIFKCNDIITLCVLYVWILLCVVRMSMYVFIWMYEQPCHVSPAPCQVASSQHGGWNLTHSKPFRETNQCVEVNHDVY